MLRRGVWVSVCIGVVCLAGRAQAQTYTTRVKEREVILASETDGCPPGYHPDTQLRYGPIIAGGITTAIGTLLLGSGIAQRMDRSTAVPGDGVGGPGSDGDSLMLLGGLHLAIGVPFLVYGLAVPRDVYVRDRGPRATFGLVPNKRGVQLGISGVF